VSAPADSCAIGADGGEHYVGHDAGADVASDEQHLLRAFRTFTETAGSLERFYGQLRAEVVRLRQELEESHAGLARSLEENRSIRQHLDRILESLPCGVVVVSSGGEITHLNPEGKRLLGFESGGEGAVPQMADLRLDLLDLLKARSTTTEREQQVSGLPGPPRWLAVRQAALASDGAGSAVFILQDISERKRLEQAQARHRREQALAEMSAVLAHEVRNPLGSLELFASLLAEAGLGPECQEWVGHLQHGLRTLTSTVNNILLFHGAPPPERMAVDLGQLLDWAASFLVPLALRGKVKLILRNGLRGVTFTADRHQLEQVLLNLSLNALRVMPDGGILELEGECDSNLSDGSTFVTLAVSDTGPGIAPEHLGQIFQAGFSTRSGSPGLGLAVSSKIVEQHRGTITGAMRTGGGARFVVRFVLSEKTSPHGSGRNTSNDPSYPTLSTENVMNQVAS
jgi:two-component system sensor histidine kinase FlrB